LPILPAADESPVYRHQAILYINDYWIHKGAAMRMLMGGAMIVMLALVGGGQADDKKDEKIDGKKLIGKWEPKEAKGDRKIAIEFTKDGKMNVSADSGAAFEGTYQLDGKKLTFQIKLGENEVKKTVTVIRLTDDEFESEGDDGKKAFRRMKGK
jgi:uncharacterized protein (TIGR03066 family)